MEEIRFNALLEEYITDAISEEDLREFYALLEDPFYRDLWNKALEKEWDLGMYEEAKDERIGQLIQQNVLERIATTKVVSIQRSQAKWIYRVSAAAVFFILLAGSFYFINSRSKHKDGQRNEAAQNIVDVSPGDNKAVLVLSDGRQVELNSLQQGFIMDQGNARITKEDSGSVAYEALDKTSLVYYNTIRTPRGGQHHVKLEDGTDVWLNAASSIRFPTVFSGKERKVEITGEAYFEVAHKTGRPFLVAARGMQVEVLGTHFTINSYENENTLKATLLKGKIKIDAEKDSAILSPGEQARISSNNHLAVVKDVDVEEAVSWKNGYFKFVQADVKTVMRQVERWYDVEVVYEGPNPEGHFNGNIPRNIMASSLIRILKAGGIQCKLDGRKIIVL
jgi:transmembrane sensor